MEMLVDRTSKELWKNDSLLLVAYDEEGNTLDKSEWIKVKVTEKGGIGVLMDEEGDSWNDWIHGDEVDGFIISR